MGMTAEIKPELIIESDGVDDERVALPAADRVTVPSGVEIIRMFADIHEDLAIAVNISLEQEKDMGWRLHDSPWIGSDARYTGRQAIRLRIVLGLSRLHNLFCFGQERNRFSFCETLGKIGNGAAAIPHAGQVGLAVRKARRRPGRRGPPALLRCRRRQGQYCKDRKSTRLTPVTDQSRMPSSA